MNFTKCSNCFFRQQRISLEKNMTTIARNSKCFVVAYFKLRFFAQVLLLFPCVRILLPKITWQHLRFCTKTIGLHQISSVTLQSLMDFAQDFVKPQSKRREIYSQLGNISLTHNTV